MCLHNVQEVRFEVGREIDIEPGTDKDYELEKE